MSPARHVAGHVDAGFEPVAEAFALAVPPGSSGAALAAVVNGKTVLDVWAGTRDDDGAPWQEDTAAVVFSGTKGLVAAAVLLLYDRGLLAPAWPVSRVWPEFARAGKEFVTVGDVLAHTAGVPGLSLQLTMADLADSERIFAALADQEPITPVGAPSYHARTYGWLVDALVRRTDGRSVAKFLADEIAEPLGLNAWIGVPDEALDRVASIRRAPDYRLSAYADPGAGGSPDPRLDLVYGNPSITDLDWNSREVLQLEIPAANGVATARSMARLYGCLAAGGSIDGQRLFQPATIAAAATERSLGPDPLSGRLLRFGTGFELAGTPSALGPAPDAFGHTGAGGSSHGAWPGLATGFSLVVSQLQTESTDGRARSVLAALYAAVAGPGISRRRSTWQPK